MAEPRSPTSRATAPHPPVSPPAPDHPAAGGHRGRWGRVGRDAGLLAALTALLGVAALANTGLGAVAISPAQTVAILLRALGGTLDVAYSDQQAAVLLAIRLPRVVLCALVGGGLAAAGAALQGLFRNPLADPGLIGVSSGAAAGAVVAILLGVAAFGAATLPLAAFGGGLAATLVAYGCARHEGRTEVVTLVLSGIAVNAVAGAVIGLCVYLADDQQLRSITFWMLGSVGGATWPVVASALPLVGLGLVGLPRAGAALNLMTLGEREARHLGLATERVRLTLILLSALVAGACVAVSGVIQFVGLVVPHLIRLVAGPDHRLLLPASALGGATLLLVTDLVARTVASPAELPLGVVTALLGGPFFLWLLLRTRRRHGGWG